MLFYFALYLIYGIIDVILALVSSIVFHTATQYIFIKLKRFDDFNHRLPTKQLQQDLGVLVYFALFLISLIYYFLKIELFDYSLFVPLGILFIIGVYDDLYQADFKLKFLMQLIVAKF